MAVQYIVKLEGTDFTRYAVADARMPKRRRLGSASETGKSSERGSRATFGDMVSGYKYFESQFWTEVSKRLRDGALDLGTRMSLLVQEDV